MKKSNFTAVVKRVLSIMLVFVLMVSFTGTINAEAKTKKISLKYCNFSGLVDYHEVEPFAKSVKKGTYNVTIQCKKGWANGYLKFTAPASKTYKITASKLSTGKGKFANGHVSFMKVDSYGGLAYTDGVVKGQKQSAMHIASRKTGIVPASLSGKIYLEQGETLYIYNSFLYSARNTKKGSFKLVIK